jgi:hypothetical protein
MSDGGVSDAQIAAMSAPRPGSGFDVLLLVFMAITALLGLLRRQLLIVSAFTTGVLLVCDA